MIRETFLPRLFFEKTKTLSPIVGTLSTMNVNKYGLGILNAVTSAQGKYLRSQRGSVERVRAVTGGGAFSNAHQIQTLSEERRDRKKYREVAYKSKLKGLVRYIKGTDKRLLLRAKRTGTWMSVRSTTVSGTVLYILWNFGIFYVHVITSLP